MGIEAVEGRHDLVDWLHGAGNEGQRRVTLGQVVVMTKAGAEKLGGMAQEKVTMD